MKEKYKKIRAKFASDLPPAEDERFPHPVSVSASKTKQTLVNHKEAFDTGPESVGDKMLQPFLIFKTKYGAVLLKIH